MNNCKSNNQGRSSKVFLSLLLFSTLLVLPGWFGIKQALAGPQNHPPTSAALDEPPALTNHPGTDTTDVKNFSTINPDILDKGDYYILANGDKQSFFRKKDHFVLIVKNNGIRRLDRQSIESQLETIFSGQTQVVQQHTLGKHMIVRVTDTAGTESITTSLQATDPNISFVSPLLTDENGVAEVAVLPKLIVRFTTASDYTAFIRKVSTTHPVALLNPLAFTDREYEFQITREINDISEIFGLARLIASEDFVEWVEPVLLTSVTKMFTPNDPLFNNQWHLHNTGQNGALVDADVDAPEGWDLSKSNGTIIAVYDDGVQTNHPDLAIWNNPGESGGGKETNGVDDDSNGFVDDYQGWDFNDSDNNPSPSLSTDNHGTAVAGVAAGNGNNGIGVSGGAVNAEILPLRATSMSCTDFGNAMRYAAKYSDVVNNSWSITACQSELTSAIADAVNGNIPGARRGAKGTPVLFATGNSASGWTKFTLSGFPPGGGTYTFKWEYTKNAANSEGYDTVWLDDISWPGGTSSDFGASTDFESDTVSTVPGNFTSGGNALWNVVNDGTHARGAAGNSVKAGTIVDSQTTYLETTQTVGEGSLTFWVWVSSEQNNDLFNFYVNNTFFFSFSPGQGGHQNTVSYPASNPDTIAVGASNNGGISGLEERSYYSQFGPEVDVVAPSNGGSQGITTTDRTGTDGYNNGSDYFSSFGGTSSATPLVSGIAATVLAYATDLTALELRNILRDGADQIGPYSYPAARNDYYGYGRVNLYNSLSLITSPLPIVTTEAVTDIDSISATGNGTITDLGSPNPVQHGFCWNTTGSPTTADTCTQEGTASATGPFSSTITGLMPNIMYYVRAYATHSAGASSYGGQVSFTTMEEQSLLPLLFLPAVLKE